MEVLLEISHHGGRKGQLVCRTDDNGSLMIPAELVTELINLGWKDPPS